MSVVSELYKRALNGDKGALAELVANRNKEELYKSVVNDGRRAIEIITVPRYENVRKALLKMQQVGIYANLDTLGGDANQIIFSSTTGLDMEDVEKLFISYIEEAVREEKKSLIARKVFSKKLKTSSKTIMVLNEILRKRKLGLRQCKKAMNHQDSLRAL